MTLSKGWLDEETFECWVPAQAVLSKGGKDGADKTGKRWIQGIASTSTRDLQGEIVEQNGIDFSYFIKHGYFNNDHKPGFENKVGQPTECRVTKNGLWVKGFLFENHKVADSIWELMHALDSSSANRKIGFSIQGKVKRRAGTGIKECWIQDVAVTPAPVNTTTWAEIAKSLTAQHPDINKAVDMVDDDEEKENKAVTAGGNPLVPESLHSKEIEDRTSKSLTFDEAVSHVQNETGLDKVAAESVAKIAFSVFKE